MMMLLLQYIDLMSLAPMFLSSLFSGMFLSTWLCKNSYQQISSLRKRLKKIKKIEVPELKEKDLPVETT